MALALDESALDASSSQLLSSTQPIVISSPSSPACARTYARNVVLEYIDEVENVLHRLHAVRTPGLPELYPTAIQDSLDSVKDWLRSSTSDLDSPSEEDVRAAFDELQKEMTASGVTLYLEVLTREARKEYEEALHAFLEWLRATQHKTGDDQPLSEAVRLIMTDFALLEKRWAEREDHITAPRREFEERTRMIRELRNEEIELRRQNPVLITLMATLPDGMAARRRQLFKHVGNRAAMLRSTPKENLSMKQRRDCKATASAVMQWLDSNYDNPEATDEDLADQLQRVTEIALETCAAADVVARRNELIQLIDFIRSCVTVQRPVMDALGPDRVQALAFVIGKCEHWLGEHPNPTIQTLEKFVESLRQAANKYGLNPPTVDDTVRAPEFLNDKAREGAAGGTDGSGSNSDGTVVGPSASQRLRIVSVACVMLEELLVLRVSCASRGAGAFIARRIAPLQVELSDVLTDPLALEDSAAALIQRYRSVLQDAPKGSVPASCWTRVLPFEDVDLAE